MITMCASSSRLHPTRADSYVVGQFKELNSRLNREVAEFERAQAAGMHYLSGGGDAYEPSSELEAEARAYVLGGAGGSRPALDESPEERRRRVLEATMGRLRREEEELEKSCGTSGPAAGN